MGTASTSTIQQGTKINSWISPLTIIVQNQRSDSEFTFITPEFLSEGVEFNFRELYEKGIHGHTTWWSANVNSESQFLTFLQLIQEHFYLQLRETGVNNICFL